MYPEPRWLLTPIWRRPLDGRRLALAVAVGVVLFPSLWRALQAQVAGADELALTYGWASTVEHLVNLWLMALLAASRRPGSTRSPYPVGESDARRNAGRVRAR